MQVLLIYCEGLDANFVLRAKRERVSQGHKDTRTQGLQGPCPEESLYDVRDLIHAHHQVQTARHFY
jgi:hypothetical protein